MALLARKVFGAFEKRAPGVFTNFSQFIYCAFISEPQPSASSKGEMNVPILANSFSVPQNVFERVLASQTRVSTTCPSSAKGCHSPSVNYSAGQPQRRRTSGNYVNELAGSEAKRPRLSPPINSEQDLAQRRHHKMREREQFRLQILQRLDNTKNNILKLLKLQHMQNLVHYYENSPLSNQADKFGSSQSSELRFHSQQGSAYERQYHTPTLTPVQRQYHTPALTPVQNDPRPVSVSPSAQGISRSSHLHSSSHSFRRMPGIVTNADQWNKQRTSYSYKSSDSVGLAWDHKTLPKIVAVHSVANDANAKAASPATPGTAGGRPADYTLEQSAVQQNQSHTPVVSLTSGINDRATFVSDRRHSHEVEEGVVTNVLPERPRCSISTEQQPWKTKSNHSERSADERESSPNDLQVNKGNFDTSYENKHIADPGHVEQSLHAENTASVELSRQFDHPGHTERLRHVDHPGPVEYSGYAGHTGHSDHARQGDVEIVEQIDLPNGNAHTDSSMTNQGITASASQMETVESQDHVHPGSLQYPEQADSEVY